MCKVLQTHPNWPRAGLCPHPPLHSGLDSKCPPRVAHGQTWPRNTKGCAQGPAGLATLRWPCCRRLAGGGAGGLGSLLFLWRQCRDGSWGGGTWRGGAVAVCFAGPASEWLFRPLCSGCFRSLSVDAATACMYFPAFQAGPQMWSLMGGLPDPPSSPSSELHPLHGVVATRSGKQHHSEGRCR